MFVVYVVFAKKNIEPRLFLESLRLEPRLADVLPVRPKNITNECDLLLLI